MGENSMVTPPECLLEKRELWVYLNTPCFGIWEP